MNITGQLMGGTLERYFLIRDLLRIFSGRSQRHSVGSKIWAVLIPFITWKNNKRIALRIVGLNLRKCVSNIHVDNK